MSTDLANELPAKLASLPLNITKQVAGFKQYKDNADSVDQWPSGEEALKDPAIVASDLESQAAFLQKLKFQHGEQHAKEEYSRTIVSDIDDAPLITTASNAELAQKNAQNKELLKQAKLALHEAQAEIRARAPLVEAAYRQAQANTAEAAQLAQLILDARLALKRIRTAHPTPHYTIPSAEALLEEQTSLMQQLDSELQEVHNNLAKRKDAMKNVGREVERQRVQRAELEHQVIKSGGDDDERLVPLYDWYTSALALHHKIHLLRKSYKAAENELHLAYLIETHELTITLFFDPNTTQLANAAVEFGRVGREDAMEEDTQLEVSDVIEPHVTSGDVHGLVAGVLARARAEIQR